MITALGVLRNNLAGAAILAIHRHLPRVFRNKNLQTIEARASYIARLFSKEDDDPIIWREYTEGDIQNHPEIGGYKTVCQTHSRYYFVLLPEHFIQTRRGVFQSDPILETFLSYYSSAGVMEPPPSEDPGPGGRPSAILALAAAAVRFILCFPVPPC